MRTFMLSLTGAVGFTFLGLFALPGQADHYHSTAPRKKGEKPSAKVEAYPKKSAKLVQIPGHYPPTEPYREPYYFPHDPPARPKPDQVRDVTMYDSYFSPYYLMVPAGMTVRWTNRSSHRHTTTAAWLWESGEMRKGESFSLTFTRPGTYYYHCRHHPRDMYGTIIVY